MAGNGKFKADDRGIVQIISNTTEGASIIVPTKEGITGSDANYAFQLYTFRISSVRKAVGKAFRLNWPVFLNQTPDLVKHQEAASLTFNLGSAIPSSRLMGRSSARITAASKLSLENETR
ncbi:MAG: hypothetical protein K6U74_06370 [Firmicutes bacterium]|nr:hypothetical protein [Bacillota bacterium]